MTWRARALLLGCFVATLAASAELWFSVSLSDLGSAADIARRVGTFAQGLASPDLSADAVVRAAQLAGETLAIACVGTGLGAAAAWVLGVFASDALASAAGSRHVRWQVPGVRLLLDGLRAVPDFAWALALLVVLGPGAWTGTLAIAISVTGVLGRAYGQLLDAVPSKQVSAAEALGGARLPTALYGRIPAVAPAAWSYTLARLECSVRNASVIGIVGGGGLGAELFEEFGYGRADRVATLLIALVLLTASIDVVSNALRTARDVRLRRWAVVASTALGIAALLPAAVTLGQNLARTDLRLALASMLRFAQPNLRLETLGSALRSTVTPLSLAWIATLAAAVGALALLRWSSFTVAARGRGPAAPPPRLARSVALALRTLALLARAVPEVAWLLLFAAALRMGPVPALLALTLHGWGVFVRLFSEAVDDHGRRLLRTGPGLGLSWLSYRLLPDLRGVLGTHVGLQGESALRSAFTLGIVGAGGLGDAFHTAVSFWHLEVAATLALTMVVVFVGLDRLARHLSRASDSL